MVSIIVTYKRDTSYLKDALQSIAEQKFRDFETVLIIDGDEDNPDEVIEKYKQSANIRVYKLEGNTGVSAARNLGIKNATGEYIYFLDADDYIYEDAIGNLVNAIDENDDLAYGSMAKTWFQRKIFIEEEQSKFERGDKNLIEIIKNSGENSVDSKKNDDSVNTDEAKVYFVPENDEIISDTLDIHVTLTGVTALGVLYKKSFLDNNDIRFDESQLYYADAPFYIKALSLAKSYKSVRESFYIKRFHNDKENNPAISQLKADDKMDYYLSSYRLAVKNAGDNVDIKNILGRILSRYFIVTYCPHLRYDKDDSVWTNEKIKPFLEEFKNVNLVSVSRYPFSWKKIIKCAKKGNIKGIVRWNSIRLANKKLKKMAGNKRQVYRFINLHIFQKFKMKDNWIIFESFVGRNCAGQPKYIYKYLQENYGDKYRYIWIVDKKNIQIDGKCTKVKRFGLRYFYYMSRSKYWVNNMRQPVWFPKHEGQIILSTWHGTPLKRLVFDMEDVLSSNPKYKNIVYRQTRAWDYLLSDNPFSTEKFQSCFRFDKDKILEYGYPANDPMYAKNRDDIARTVKQKLNIPEDKKVILYAPTWRDDNYYEAGQYKFELALDINRLNKEFGDEYVLLLRMHYWIVDNLDMTQFGSFVYDGSSYDDITELYLISDICITDYSSVFFDYANLKRPILFYTYDLEKYRDVLRGFYLDVEKDLPGPLLLTNDDVVNAIKNIDDVNKEYREKYDEFYNRFCCRDDGFASKRVVEEVFKPEK